MPEFYFTFGHNHVDSHGKPLTNRYCVIDAEDLTTARGQMAAVRGQLWSTVHSSRANAGVTHFKLKPVDLADLRVVPPVCEACDSVGFRQNAERCDTCRIYASDEEARPVIYERAVAFLRYRVALQRLLKETTDFSTHEYIVGVLERYVP